MFNENIEDIEKFGNQGRKQSLSKEEKVPSCTDMNGQAENLSQEVTPGQLSPRPQLWPMEMVSDDSVYVVSITWGYLSSQLTMDCSMKKGGDKY